MLIESLPNTNEDASFGKLPHNVRELLSFGHPDIVLTYGDSITSEKAVFASEITKAKPAADHWRQRFTNIAGPCICRIPSIIILPFKMTEGKFKSELKSDFFYTMNRVMEIHKTPICIVEWQTSSTGILGEDPLIPKVPDRKSPPMKNLINFLNLVISYTLNGKDFQNLFSERLVRTLNDELILKITETLTPSKEGRLTTVEKSGLLDTNKLEKWLKTKTKKPFELPPLIKTRDKCLIFRPYENNSKSRSLRSRIHERNGNPFNGMPFAFDYMFCRLGPTPRDRDISIILDLSAISFKDFNQYAQNIHKRSPLSSSKIPSTDDLPKYTLHITDGYTAQIKDVIRQWCHAADIIVLKDVILPFYK